MNFFSHFICFVLCSVPLWATSPPLAQVFCSQWLHRGKVVANWVHDPAAWKEFVKVLEQRAMPHAGHPMTALESENTHRCVSKVRDRFEEGEFLLEGRRVLHSLVKQSRVPSSASALDPKLTSVQVPGLGSVLLRRTAEAQESSDAERVTQRSKYYDLLWDGFLDRLRKTMTDGRDPLKIE